MPKQYHYLKYYAYRFAWPMRYELTPSKRRTWGLWFKSKFGEDIESYHMKVMELRKRKAKSGKQKNRKQ